MNPKLLHVDEAAGFRVVLVHLTPEERTVSEKLYRSPVGPQPTATLHVVVERIEKDALGIDHWCEAGRLPTACGL
jgi:hypothetical protein